MIRWSCVWGVLLAIWQASGPVKMVDGVVAIDEAHSEWERLDMPLDRRHFGTRSEYNYADFVRGLEARNGPVRRLHGPATEGALDGVAVLILKTPTVPFSSDECATIERFVRAGGGLFLIGDHTDVFGMNTVLADVATPFGMRFEPVALFESDIVGGEVLAPGRLPPHPIVSSMRPMHWMTSCALRLDLPARPIVWSSLSYADKADYGRYTFFGDHILATDEAWGSFCQAAVAEVGAGRVLAFTDSTLLSNFSIFCPGVREIAFGGVEWLRQRESWGSWRLLALALVVGMAVPWRLPRRWEMLAALTLGAASGLCVSRVSVTRAMQGFERELAGRETVFDTTCSAGQLPLWHESHEFRDEFWELFSCFQRSGGLMRVAMPGEDPLTGSTAIFIWPKNPMVDSLASRVEAFVKGGGRLYVFDDRIAGGSGANDLVMPFGLRFERMVGGCRVPAKEVPGAKSFVDIQNAAQVTGGCAVVRDENGNTLVARVAYGSGSVVACGVAADLSSMFMGSAGVLHGAEGEDLVQLSYEIIDAGLRNDRRPAGTR